MPLALPEVFEKSYGKTIGFIFLLVAILIVLGFLHLLNPVGIAVVFMVGFIVLVIWMGVVAPRAQLPVKTITVTKPNGTTGTYTGRVKTRSYLVCPLCGAQFNASAIGTSSYGTPYARDPERYATKLLRWHLIQIHHYERLVAQKAARTLPFHHEERPA